MERGDIIQAKTECLMKYMDGVKALIVGKKYPIQDIVGGKMVIQSEIDPNHYFDVSPIDIGFYGKYFYTVEQTKVLDLISHVDPERHITATFTEGAVTLDYVVRIQYDKEQDTTISKEPIVTTNQIKIIIDHERIEEQIEEALQEMESKEISYE